MCAGRTGLGFPGFPRAYLGEMGNSQSTIDPFYFLSLSPAPRLFAITPSPATAGSCSTATLCGG